MNKRKDTTTISISHKTLEMLRNNLGYRERNGKRFLETYNDLLTRLLKIRG